MKQTPTHEFEGFVHSIELLRDKAGWDAPSYPFALPALRGWDRLFFHPRVTFLVGENGSGKSTLIEALAVASGFNPEGGSRNFNFATRTSHSALHEYLRVARGPRRRKDGYFLRAESYFNVASEIERLDLEPGGRWIIHPGRTRSSAFSQPPTHVSSKASRIGGFE
jgi:predicted ATPase